MRRVLLVALFLGTACSTEDLAGPPRPLGLPIVNLVDIAPAVTEGFGTDIDLELVLGGPDPEWIDPNASAPYKSQLLSGQANLPILRNWFEDVVQQALAAANDDLTLLRALSEYWEWYEVVQDLDLLLNAPLDKVFGPKLNPFYEGAALKLRLAIQGNLTRCRELQSLAALANVSYWQDRASELLVDTPAYGLDFESIVRDIQNLCVQVVMESAVLPNLLEVGSHYSLTEVFALRFSGQEATVPAAFEVKLLGDRVILGNAQQSVLEGFTNASGLFETPVVPTEEGLAQIMSYAFLVLPGRTVSTPVVGGLFELTRNVLLPTEPPPPPPLGNLTGTWDLRIGVQCGTRSDQFAGQVTFTNGVASFSFLAGIGQCQIGARLSGAIMATLNADEFREFFLTNVIVDDLTYQGLVSEPPCQEETIQIPGPVAMVGGSFGAVISVASICRPHSYWLVELTPTSPL